MLTGLPPLFDEDRTKLYDRLLTEEPVIPESLSPNVRDLLGKILKKDPKERIGYENGALDIMNHPFCEGIDFDKLYRKEIDPPTFLPSFQDTNFDFEEKILPIEFYGSFSEFQFEELNLDDAYVPTTHSNPEVRSPSCHEPSEQEEDDMPKLEEIPISKFETPVLERISEKDSDLEKTGNVPQEKKTPVITPGKPNLKIDTNPDLVALDPRQAPVSAFQVPQKPLKQSEKQRTKVSSHY